MAHAFGDYRDGDAFGFGGGGPAVTRNIERQGNRDTDHSGDAFQVVVDVVACVAVGGALVDSSIADDGQQVVAIVLGILVEDSLHLLCPRYDQLLAGLAAPICDITVFEVGLFQKSHVDETHTSEIEAHKKHISGIVQSGRQRKVECLDFTENGQRQCTFYGLVHSCIDVPEWIAVLDDVILHCTVIYRTKDAGVEGDGVRGDSPFFLPCLITLHYFRGNAVQHDVFILSVLFEAAERGLVGFGSADFAVLFQLGYETLHVVEQGIFMRIAVELVDHIGGCVCQTIGI